MTIRTARYMGDVPEDLDEAVALSTTIDRYLPRQYTAVLLETFPMTLVIVGIDSAGWTMDDFVLPRLASGLYFFAEVKNG